MHNLLAENRFARGLALLLPILLTTPAFADVTTPPRAVEAITALHAAGADLAVDLMLLPGAPGKIVVGLETAGGRAEGSVVLSPAAPGRSTVTFKGTVERFLTDGFDYRLRLSDGNGVAVAEPSDFTVGMSCAGEVCRFVPELGVKTGGATWLEDRLAAALRAADPTVPDLLAAAASEDSSLAGAARDLSARLAGEADGSCRCRWAYSTTPATCGDPGITLGIYDRGVRQDGLSAHQIWSGGVRLETACWTARLDGIEKIRIAFGEREVSVGCPRVRLAPCGSCAGLATTHVAFLGGAYALAEGASAVATRASWSYSVAADSATVLAASDVRAASSPNGEDQDESIRDWTGTAGAVGWQAEMEADLEAPRGLDRGIAAAQLAYDIRTTTEAACAMPPAVSVGRSAGWRSLGDPLLNPIDPNQISVVIGECRPPR
jgi:hypothetical protein